MSPASIETVFGDVVAEQREAVTRRRRVVIVACLVLAVSLLHYETQITKPLLHDVYRRLYYVPVGLSAIWFGLRGGLLVSFLVGLAYAPHIVLDWHHQGRELVNQLMEVALYFLIGGLVGYFADLERRYRERWREAAEELERSYGELKRQADMILEAEEQLRRADRLSAVGQLAAGMAHEIRNPLGAIKGTAEILRDDYPPDHPKAEFVEILLKETDRLNGVVENFLSYSRQRNSDEGIEPVDLGVLVRETAALLETPARKAGVRVDLQLDGELLVRGSPTQLKQIVVNLLLNALQATPAGGSVRVCTEVRSGRVRGPEYRQVDGRLAALIVEDEGPGIAVDTMSRVFEPFFTTKAQGTGLGLAISQRIAQAHGGQIEVENRSGGGARFTLALPVTSGLEETKTADG